MKAFLQSAQRKPPKEKDGEGKDTVTVIMKAEVKFPSSVQRDTITGNLSTKKIDAMLRSLSKKPTNNDFSRAFYDSAKCSSVHGITIEIRPEKTSVKDDQESVTSGSKV